MPEVGDLAVAVKREAAVGNRHVDDAAGPQHAQVVLDRADRVLAVLDHVVRDHEVDASVRDARKRLTVVDDVRRDYLVPVELGIVLAKLPDGEAVYVPHRRVARYS